LTAHQSVEPSIEELAIAYNTPGTLNRYRTLTLASPHAKYIGPWPHVRYRPPERLFIDCFLTINREHNIISFQPGPIGLPLSIYIPNGKHSCKLKVETHNREVVDHRSWKLW
jgi:hypothetical protein